MVEDFKVTPWEVSGEIDYVKLQKGFGMQLLTDDLLTKIQKHAGGLHHFLRRKLFFCHRDLNWLLTEYEKGNKFFLYTGRGPSGKTHVGHLVPYMITKWLQDKFDAELWFQMTDDEKFLFKQELSLEETNKMAYENALDVIAMGFKKGKTFIFADTDYAKTLYREALKVAKRVNFSTVKAVFGLGNDSNVGQIFFTSMQAVPAFLPSVLKGKNIPCLIPYAVDQDPHFRVTRDIMPKLGYYKPASLIGKFLPPLEGPGGKMSTTGGGIVIYTTDGPKEVENKIKRYAFSGGRATVEEHRKKGGNPEVDVSYQWLLYFEESDAKLKKIYDDYKCGKLLTSELKEMLIEKLNRFLKQHQQNREKAKKVLDKFILKD